MINIPFVVLIALFVSYGSAIFNELSLETQLARATSLVMAWITFTAHIYRDKVKVK